jgi:hypothetical protein
MENKEKTFELKPYSRKELRNFYGVSWHVFKKMLKQFEHEIGEEHGKYLTVKQVETVFRCLGTPRKIILKN